ncbi:MAG: hypothetical protein Fur0041_03700 [Bacteroidia bacterium]
MKKYISLLTFLFVITVSLAANERPIEYKELFRNLNEKLAFTAAEKQELGTGIAIVHFKVRENGTLEIVKIDASNDKQRKAIEERIDSIFISNAPVKNDEVYKMKIAFTTENVQ